MRILKLKLFSYALLTLCSVPLLAQRPAISAIQNNYSYTLPSVPNYGIAPGSLFVIYGSNLSTVTAPVLQSSAAPGVPLTLNGVSASVSVNGMTVPVPLYYVSANQIAGILPSTVPAGTANITVTNNGQTSAPASITVVASDFGILTANNLGNGQAAAYDANNKILSQTNSTSPGRTIVLWGSGVGSDTANDDRIYPQKQNNLTGIPMQVFIGGVAAPILYRGRSQFPGVDQINVTVPAGVATGCYVSLAVVSQNYVSNSTTLPIAANGGTCSDPNVEFTPAQLISLKSKNNVNIGTIFLDQETRVSNNTVRSIFRGKFLGYSKAAFDVKTPSGAFISYGSCQIDSQNMNPTHLNAGAVLTVSGSGGQLGMATLSTLSNGSVGDYRGMLPAGFIPNGGGTYNFNNGSGSAAVGPLVGASANVLQPIVWTNMGSLSAINKAQGATVTWTGGLAGTFVAIQGSVAGPAPDNTNVAFSCAAPASAGKFTIPPSLLLAIPAGIGKLVVNTVTVPSTFTASGLDLGLVYAQVGTNIPVTYQ